MGASDWGRCKGQRSRAKEWGKGVCCGKWRGTGLRKEATLVLGVREPAQGLEGREAELLDACRRGRAGLAEDRPQSRQERSG